MADETGIPLLETKQLTKYFYSSGGLLPGRKRVVKAVDDVSLSIRAGETFGLVGESGCGKSVTSLSLMQLVQGPMGQIVSGSIRFRSTVRTPADPQPIMEEVKDENGNTVLDEDGNPVLKQAVDKNGKPKFEKVSMEPVMIEELDDDGTPVLYEDGNPVMVQALNKRGNPRFKKKYEEHEEVFDIAKMPISDMSSIRGREIAMIFQ